MNTQIENKYSMYLAVKEFFTNNLSTLEGGTPGPLTNRVNVHNTLTDDLAALLGISGENTSGYATQKQLNRASMQEKVISVAGALHAIFLIAEDNVQAAKAYTTPSGLNAMRDTEVFVYARKIHSLAGDNLAALSEMKIAEAYVNSLGADITAYEDKMQEPKDQRSAQKAANQAIPDKEAEIDGNLRITDSIMQALQPTQKALVLQYKGVRLIDDNAASTTPPDVSEAIEAGTIERIYTVPYLSSRRFELTNTSADASLNWTLSDSETEATNPWNELAAGSTSSLLSENIAPNGEFLLVQNENDTDVVVELRVSE